jgi:hypothetical protein
MSESTSTSVAATAGTAADCIITEAMIQAYFDKPISMLNEGTTSYVNDVLAGTLPETPGVMKTLLDSINHATMHKNQFQYCMFGADKVGLKPTITVRQMCDALDINYVANVATEMVDKNQNCDQDIYIERIMMDGGGCVLHNRNQTMAVSLHSINSLKTGYFHYFNVIGDSDSANKAFMFMCENMEYTEACWGGLF